MGMLDENGNFPIIGKIFLVDAIGSVVGTCMGVTVVTSYVESASGIEVGGRTGLASVVTGLFFLLAVLFASVFDDTHCSHHAGTSHYRICHDAGT